MKRRALELGFDTVGVTDLAPPPNRQALERWIQSGMAGTMSYMGRQLERRANPRLIAPWASRAIMLTRSYYRSDPVDRVERLDGKGRVARYARGRDYHEALRPALEQLGEDLVETAGGGVRYRAFCDAGPVPERELAQRAGLGWIGKNTMLIDPERGSYFFLAAIFTDADLALDHPFDLDRCGTCTRCLEACPTDAFPKPHVLDATRCISYLTIEYRGNIEPTLAGLMGDLVFGCDICQEVCPWNEKFARPAQDETLDQDPAVAAIDLLELLELDAEQFERRYGWTPLERPGVGGMQRNARVALRNESEGGAVSGRQVSG